MGEPQKHFSHQRAIYFHSAFSFSLFSKAKGSGRPGKSIFVNVPPGTVVYDDKKVFQKELSQNGDTALVAKGGHGGSHRTLNFNGIKGEKKNITLELKLLGDVGLVG